MVFVFILFQLIRHFGEYIDFEISFGDEIYNFTFFYRLPTSIFRYQIGINMIKQYMKFLKLM